MLGGRDDFAMQASVSNIRGFFTTGSSVIHVTYSNNTHRSHSVLDACYSRDAPFREAPHWRSYIPPPKHWLFSRIKMHPGKQARGPNILGSRFSKQDWYCRQCWVKDESPTVQETKQKRKRATCIVELCLLYESHIHRNNWYVVLGTRLIIYYCWDTVHSAVSMRITMIFYCSWVFSKIHWSVASRTHS